MHIVGIDPGASGALVLLEDDHILDICDMPTVTVKIGKTNSQQMNISAIVKHLTDWENKFVIDHIYMERVHFIRGKSGATAATRFIEGFGILRGIIGALRLPLTLVPVHVWKPALRCPAEKPAARARACEIFPVWAGAFDRVKDDGRAEAAMIALYGVRQVRGQLNAVPRTS